MQLFSRSVSFVGPITEVMSYAVAIREHVSEKIGREVAMWDVLFGAPVGTVVYTARVGGIADLQSIGATLIADPEYHELLATGSAFNAGPAVDTLATPLHGELGDTPPPVGSVAGITTATIANGKYVEAIAWGIEMSQYVESVTGVPGLFLMQEYGPFGAVTWIGSTPDAASSDAVGQKLNADPGYIERLQAAGGLFAQGSGHRALATRLA